MTLGKRKQEIAGLRSKRMMLPIASAMKPPHLPRRSGGRQRVQHRQDGCCPDTRAEQHDRALSEEEYEASAGRTDGECRRQQLNPNLTPEIARYMREQWRDMSLVEKAQYWTWRAANLRNRLEKRERERERERARSKAAE
jgi:hypothetical protein